MRRQLMQIKKGIENSKHVPRVRGMGMSLVLQGKEIKNMTDFEVLFDILPFLKNEKRCTYKFSGYKDIYEKLYP